MTVTTQSIRIPSYKMNAFQTQKQTSTYARWKLVSVPQSVWWVKSAGRRAGERDRLGRSSAEPSSHLAPEAEGRSAQG